MLNLVERLGFLFFKKYLNSIDFLACKAYNR